MPLFGFRKDKKHEQSHIQAQAGLAKGAATAGRKVKNAGNSRRKTSVRPEKISSKVVTRDGSSAKLGPIMPSGNFTGMADPIIRPRVTEKSGILSQANVYTFEVDRKSNKTQVAKAVRALYKVKPVKITVINVPSKAVFVKGRKGTVAGFKKAMVTLKAGDKIDLV